VPDTTAPQAGQDDPAGTVPAVDQLTFLDLLYSVPIGDLAVRVSGAQLRLITPADWSALAVVLAVIVLSWIGLHKDRAITADENHPDSRIGDIGFARIEFAQFLIEVAIIGLYFAMGLTLQLPTASRPATPLPSESWLTAFLLLIFIAYLAWDLIDIRRASKAVASRVADREWPDRARKGRSVTLFSLPAWIAIYVAVRLAPPRAAPWVVGLNVLLVALLYAYRVAQDRRGNTS